MCMVHVRSLDRPACDADAHAEVVVRVAAEQRTPLSGLKRTPRSRTLVHVVILR